jgi:hypothetical protein
MLRYALHDIGKGSWFIVYSCNYLTIHMSTEAFVKRRWNNPTKRIIKLANYQINNSQYSIINSSVIPNEVRNLY